MSFPIFRTSIWMTYAVAGLAVLGVFVGAPQAASGYTVTSLPATDQEFNDFVVGPGRAEVSLPPGASTTVTVRVANRMQEDRLFTLSVEDFTGSRSLENPVSLLGDARGPYSLKDYLSPEVDELVVEQGTRVDIPVVINIPANADPGGRYGSVLVSTESLPTDAAAGDGTRGGAAIISRLGVLFFVRVEGDIEEEGHLLDFALKGDKDVYLSDTPIDFELVYENNGSVHLAPYGQIEITNMLGDVVGSVPVADWLVLPDALRLKELSWERPLLIGRYTAVAEIEREGSDQIDRQELVFWVVPLKLIGSVFAAILLVLLLIRFIATRFEIRKR